MIKLRVAVEGKVVYILLDDNGFYSHNSFVSCVCSTTQWWVGGTFLSCEKETNITISSAWTYVSKGVKFYFTQNVHFDRGIFLEPKLWSYKLTFTILQIYLLTLVYAKVKKRILVFSWWYFHTAFFKEKTHFGIPLIFWP